MTEDLLCILKGGSDSGDKMSKNHNIFEQIPQYWDSTVKMTIGDLTKYYPNDIYDK